MAPRVCTFTIVLGLLLMTILSLPSAYGCIHDQIDHKVVVHEQNYSPMHPFTDESRRRRQRNLRAEDNPTNYQTYDRAQGDDAAISLYEPIRITPYYDNSTLNKLSADKRQMIFKIVPAAIERFKLALQVVPVQGNLTAKRSCYMQYKTTPPVCKTFVNNEACLEMPIPLAHFGPTRQCSDCTTANCAKDPCTTTTGQGVKNSDFLLYVRAATTSYCSGSVLAYASSCQKDQYDRPTFGMANFCPDQIDSDPVEYEHQLATALHEITHALGFSSQFFAYMRYADGTPRTPRDASGRPPIVTTGTCKNGDPVDYFVAPDTSTVQYVNERDRVIAKLVTPNVAKYVQTHFNCSSLIGAELESQDDGCLGSHWEERLFEPEYMSPVSSYRNIFSGLTLAYFADSGWYRTNLSTAERLHFGANKGCKFASDKCIDKTTQTSIAPDHYCTSNSYESCSVDATSRSVCTLMTGKTIPPYSQYFTDPTKGGNNDYADFCPLNIGYIYGDCGNPSNLAVPSGTTLNILGETYCATCKCTNTTLRSADSSDWIVSGRRQTGCYAMKCIPGTSTVEVTVASGAKAVKVNCTSKGAQMKIAGFSGMLTCPDPFTICGVEALSTVDSSSGLNLKATVASAATSTHAQSKVAASLWMMVLAAFALLTSW